MNIEQINIHSLSSLPVNERKNLPKSAGIYFVISCEEIIYIGVSNNLRLRWQQHHKLETILNFDSVKIAWSTPEIGMDLSEFERNAIDFFQPKLNNAKGCYPSTLLKEPFENVPSKGVKVKLKQLLKDKDKSLLALSNETGISYNTLHRIKENTAQGITYDVLEKICLNLDCKPNDLLEIEP